ncbi:Cu(+)/Ag(+) sensor histidine kinase [Intestinirhabdus alba]|jgi:two-component system heavy metal sensor histidine kinase CusS|uniref:Sensor protein n=1 Tax=Intestinirhabdus alba TaxID=2899544 RepID=A0A6L6IIA2_9ENTR|nr:Cu(+)/Ag(+) sensor histidine kinase [Intestinirhabdus alba]MTH44810.1 heavy metal sensor histidine kinase [Intestinirhabdus alba]
MSSKPLARPFSLATRLTFFISLATIAAFFAFAWIMIQSVNVHFAQQDINDLTGIGASLERVLTQSDEPEARRVEILKNVVSGYSNLIISLEDADGKALFHTPGAPDIRLLLSHATPDYSLPGGNVYLFSDPAMPTTERGAHGSWRMVRLPVSYPSGEKPAYILYMALSIDFHLHYINGLKNKLTVTASLICILIVIIILFAVYKGHAPLRRVSRRIHNFTSRDLDVRLDPLAVPIELEQLVISFNHMLERIEDVFTRQSNFSADIAHEIRTPITNLVTQTEIALSQPRTRQELEEVLYSNLEEFARMSVMVSDMLFLAQADNNQLIPQKKQLDLIDEIGKVFDFFEALAEERKVTLRLEGPPCRAEGDPIMLRRAISNLLSNALRYTPPGAAITVRVAQEETLRHISVENPGPAIAAEHLPRLFDRFYRVDPSRQRKGEGSGIGLAIVKSIATAHRGSVSVSSDARVTRFTLSLPARPCSPS